MLLQDICDMSYRQSPSGYLWHLAIYISKTIYRKNLKALLPYICVVTILDDLLVFASKETIRISVTQRYPRSHSNQSGHI